MSEFARVPLILVVDDEPSIASFLRDFLEDNGFSVKTAGTGKEGVEMALAASPDAILLDVELPDMKGYEVCRLMREKSTLRTKPILMLTSLADARHEVEGLRAGADDYLGKPIDTARLLARLNAAIHRNVRELDANPLTHLPGNASITQELERRIAAGSPFAVIYADLNNFKAYNDRYGFLRGDQVIRLCAQCLLGAAEASAGPHSFVGHVGGDDFVIVAAPEKAGAVCEDVISRFDGAIPAFYDEADRAAGHLPGKTRRGEDVRFPFVGIALAVVDSRARSFAHPAEVSALAGELKSWAKTFGKSAWVADRRKPA